MAFKFGFKVLIKLSSHIKHAHDAYYLLVNKTKTNVEFAVSAFENMLSMVIDATKEAILSKIIDGTMLRFMCVFCTINK